MPSEGLVQGQVEPGFERVRVEFEKNLSERGEVGGEVIEAQDDAVECAVYETVHRSESEKCPCRGHVSSVHAVRDVEHQAERIENYWEFRKVSEVVRRKTNLVRQQLVRAIRRRKLLRVDAIANNES